MAKLTGPQEQLLKDLKDANYPATWQQLKNRSTVKNFDLTFNALLWKGYFKHFIKNDNSNSFIKTSKF